MTQDEVQLFHELIKYRLMSSMTIAAGCGNYSKFVKDEYAK